MQATRFITQCEKLLGRCTTVTQLESDVIWWRDNARNSDIIAVECVYGVLRVQIAQKELKALQAERTQLRKEQAMKPPIWQDVGPDLCAQRFIEYDARITKISSRIHELFEII